MRRALPLIALLAAGAAAASRWLRYPAAAPRTPEGQAALERAVAAVDRELAADLELMSMFDQTKQAFVLENGQFLASRDVIEREAPAAYAVVADVFERIPATEAAMERRGPAASIADADRALIHAWEGDAREAQRVLRASLTPSRLTRWNALAARLRARFASR
jgi:hypothetical protein